MMKNHEFYYKKLESEPEYTTIPIQYWINNDRISSKEYVLERMNEKELTAAVLERACIRYPEIFCYYMLGIRLRPYQHYAIDLMWANNYTALAWSRRLGKSTTVKLFILWTSFFNKLPGNLTGTTWNIVLQDQEIANSLYIEPLHELMEHGDKIVHERFKNALGEHYFTDRLVTRREKSGKVRSNQISFKTATGICRINTLPPTSKAIGREGNIAGDEVSKWKNNTKIRDEFKYYDQLEAIMKDNPIYKAVFLSTPEGADDMFALEIFDPNDQIPQHRYKKIWYPYWARVEQEWLDEMDRTKENATRNKRYSLFQQEYEAKFLTISDPFFDFEQHIKPCINNEWKEPYCLDTPCSLGIDWGGTQKSETALAITKWDLKENTKKKVIYIKHYQVGDDLNHLDSELVRIKKLYNIKWVVPDNKGGRWIIPRLEELFGKGRVHLFNFTTDKIQGYETLRNALNQREIEIPNYNPLIEQMKGMNEKLKPNSSKGKDDIIDAVMMSNYPLLQKEIHKFNVITYTMPRSK